MNNNLILLKALLLSTSRFNILRHCAQKKKRRKIVGGMIGSGIIYAILMAYCIFTCIGYGTYGMIEQAPVMCAIVVSVLSFMLTIFKTNGYLFHFKEYDMLLALPFSAKSVAACKFLYMYLQSLPWYLSIGIAMLAGYGIYARPSIAVYPIWIILSFFLPLIPMLLASFIGYLIARISARFRKTNIVQTVLLIVFVIACFALRFVIEDIIREQKVEQTLQSMSSATTDVARFYLPVGWFAAAVTRYSVVDIMLLIGVSAALFALLFMLVGKSYIKINSALKSHAAARKYSAAEQRRKSVLNAIAFKEFKRMTGSSNYMVNTGIGVILATLLSVIVLIIGFERVVGFVTHDAPFDAAILQPAIPFIVYFFIGMMATTACSPSLEGKNYWIMQSLPLEKKTIYRGKMLFNLYLTVPFMLLCVTCALFLPPGAAYAA